MAPRTLDALIVDAQGGNRSALGAVCAAVRPPVLVLCRRLLGDRLDAEDAVQETLVVVSRRIVTYGGAGSFMGWVYAIAAREAARVGARRATTLELIADDLDAALLRDHEGLSEPEWRAVEQEVHLACAVAVVALLGDVDRLVYVLGDLLGVGDRHGAQIVGTSPAAYRQRLARARRTVREHVAAASGIGPLGAPQPGRIRAPDQLEAKADALGVLARAGGLPAAGSGTGPGVRAA